MAKLILKPVATQSIHRLFPTIIYQKNIWSKVSLCTALHRGLLKECKVLQEEDAFGREWSKLNYRHGYTSYNSVNDLHQRFAHFSELERKITTHVMRFATAVHWDLQRGKLAMTDCWVNVMGENSTHSLHLHPNSVVSGTYYVQIPKGSSPLKFEDPRLSKMMASPSRKRTAPLALQPFVTLKPEPGQVVLFESWLRHEVPMSPTKTPRISISFNYDWVK